MNTAVILAGGTGTRLTSDIPKQYIEVNDRAIITYCLETFVNHESVDRVHIVANEYWHGFIQKQAEKYCKDKFNQKFVGFSKPGETRQLSILNALQDIKQSAVKCDNVIIHDAARPLISGGLITACFEKLGECDGVLPVLPMKDTVYYSANKKSIELLDRSSLFAGQAPEAFDFEKYYEANVRLFPDRILKINGSTEPAIIAGMNISMIDGDENNFKITTMADLEKFKNIVNSGSEQSH